MDSATLTLPNLTFRCPPNTTIAMDSNKNFFAETTATENTITWQISLTNCPTQLRKKYWEKLTENLPPFEEKITPEGNKYIITHAPATSGRIKNSFYPVALFIVWDGQYGVIVTAEAPFFSGRICYIMEKLVDSIYITTPPNIEVGTTVLASII